MTAAACWSATLLNCNGGELQRGGAFGVAEPPGDGVQVDPGREQLGGGAVPEFLQRAADPGPIGVAAVAVRHGVRVPRLPPCRVG